MSGTLVLVRHGQSEWNLKNLFTGWKDPDLTEKGVAEAKAAGQRLKAKGLKFDLCFTSRADAGPAHAGPDPCGAWTNRIARNARPGPQRARLWRAHRAQQG